VELFDIRGDLYFGATTHVEDALRSHLDAHPGQRFVLLRLHGVNRLDVSGVRMLERLVRTLRERGGDLYLTRVQRPVLRFLIKTRFHEYLGRDHFLAADGAIGHLFHRVLDPATCVYECDTRAFRECQTIPRPDVALPLPVLTHAPPDAVETMTPQALWSAMSGDGQAPHVVDVREPREFAQGHVPQAENVPLPRLLDALDTGTGLAGDGLVLVCRGGRRSRDAAAVLQARSADDVRVLDGGMLAWESTGLLTAVGGQSDS
jgi:SulP family sulfate permease